jgi:hypothetical protein
MIPAPTASEIVGGRSRTICCSTLSCCVYEITEPSRIFPIVVKYWS